jgi:hypothetical protein
MLAIGSTENEMYPGLEKCSDMRVRSFVKDKSTIVGPSEWRMGRIK